ncbi:Nitrogen permease regulator 2 [Nakaseomyces bracarensis]|uniref:Nitrogen permease regulator 2 n=1 Tax=Nakaseomyces bracarensis TaxID=273131 RepID=A0ABR4NLK2_9SACH
MNSQFDGFVNIHSVFYSIFHPTEGTKVKYDFPPRSLEKSGINFDSIKNYIIPKHALCHRLITFKYEKFRIACYPVTINSSIYARNFFSFNFVFVFPYDCETSPYEPAIERLGKMFRVLEIQNQILSKAEKDPIIYNFKSSDKGHNYDVETASQMKNDDMSSILTSEQRYKYEKLNDILSTMTSVDSSFSIRDLLMRIYQDLNTYSECLIPIDEGNAVDIKLFPLLAPPTPYISSEDVPISLVNLSKIVDVNWDPIMLSIIPFINGLNTIYMIAELSKNDERVVIEFIRHLVYYNCLILTDIFQFTNIYAPTSNIHLFLMDPLMASDCQTYVVLPSHSKLPDLDFDHNTDKASSVYKHERHYTNDSNTTSLSSFNGTGSRRQSRSSSVEYKSNNFYKNKKQSESTLSTSNSRNRINNSKFLPTKSILFDLYRSLSQGITLQEWYKFNYNVIREQRIDIRRFITFGLLRGIIYRCSTHPIITSIDHLENLLKLNELTDKTNDAEKAMYQTRHINSNAADEALMNAYKKLSITENLVKGVVRSETNNSSLSGTPELGSSKVSAPKRAKRLSKVSFETVPDQKKLFKWTSQNESYRTDLFWDNLKKEEKDILLQCLTDADSIDKMSVLLERPRNEVQELLNELDDFKMVHL